MPLPSASTITWKATISLRAPSSSRSSFRPTWSWTFSPDDSRSSRSTLTPVVHRPYGSHTRPRSERRRDHQQNQKRVSFHAILLVAARQNSTRHALYPRLGCIMDREKPGPIQAGTSEPDIDQCCWT